MNNDLYPVTYLPPGILLTDKNNYIKSMHVLMDNLRTNTTYLIFVLLPLLLVYAGCKSGSDEKQPSITEKKRLSIDPKAARFLIQAQDAFRRKAYNPALIMADSAEQYAPELADIQFLRGLVFTELRRYDKAAVAYHKVLSLDPDYQGVWLNLGSTAFRQGDVRKALDLYLKEHEAYPSAAALHQMGRVYAKLGKPDSARLAYEQAIATDSTFTTAYLRLGELYKEEGELEKALEYSRLGLRLQPDNLNYGYFVGSLLLLTGEAEEAVDHLETVIELRPWHYWGNYNLGQALMRLGRQEEGKRYLAKAESLQAELKNIQDWQDLAENNPDQLMLWVNLGEALRRAGRVDEAIEAHNIALTLEPRFLAVHNNLANLYLMRGDTSTAISHYNAILQTYPTLADVWLNLGAVYANMGRVEAARQAWENALKYAPNDSTVKDYLSQLPEN